MRDTKTIRLKTTVARLEDSLSDKRTSSALRETRLKKRVKELEREVKRLNALLASN